MDILQSVLIKLNAHGAISPINADYLNLLIAEITLKAKNFCNISDLSEGAKIPVINFIVGTYLLTEKAAQNKADGCVNSIRMGDTTVSFSGDTPETLLNSVVIETESFYKELVPWRCLKCF